MSAEFEIKIMSGPGKISCGETGIDQMVKDSYLSTRYHHGHAFEVIECNHKKLVGYYMISFKSIMLDRLPDEITDYSDAVQEIPAVYIRYIAIEKKYQHYGIGSYVLAQIIKDVKGLGKNGWPIRLIYLEALDDKVKWYQNRGFKVMENKSIVSDSNLIPMYMDMLDDDTKEIIESEMEV